MRAFYGNKILTTRNSLQEFAGFACARTGLRTSNPEEGSAQRDTYFFGNINFLISLTAALMQVFYAFILSQLVIPQWINPLRPNDSDDYFSPAFLMRFRNQETLNWPTIAVVIFFIVFFPFAGIHVVNTVSSLVVRVRTLPVPELSTFIPQYLADALLIPEFLRTPLQLGKTKRKETTHLLPAIPLQMPGPGTNSLVISVAWNTIHGHQAGPDSDHLAPTRAAVSFRAPAIFALGLFFPWLEQWMERAGRRARLPECLTLALREPGYQML